MADVTPEEVIAVYQQWLADRDLTIAQLTVKASALEGENNTLRAAAVQSAREQGLGETTDAGSVLSTLTSMTAPPE